MRSAIVKSVICSRYGENRPPAWVNSPLDFETGRELATLAPAAGGTRLHFADAAAGEPLLKMALLGAALVLDAG